MWGFQALRNNRWKNEQAFLTPIPPEKGAGLGLMMFSRAATLAGLQVPSPSVNLDVKPYVIADLNTDRVATPPTANVFGRDVGFDVKYAVTQNLTADVTYNTDDAQVEADEQQVNLTRFSLFFPEKRDFFLENQGTFAVGGAGTTVGGGAISNPNVPVLFYSPADRPAGAARGAHPPWNRTSP